MIDSIKLALPTSDVLFTSYVGFRNVSERALEELIINNGYRDGPDYLNYEKIYIHNGGYLPAIGICAYKQQAPMLWIRVSLPKLIYQSNIYEVCQNDYNKIVQQIQNTVSSLGVDIPAQAIYNAKIWEIHLCKNFDLNSNMCRCVICFK